MGGGGIGALVDQIDAPQKYAADDLPCIGISMHAKHVFFCHQHNLTKFFCRGPVSLCALGEGRRLSGGGSGAPLRASRLFALRLADRACVIGIHWALAGFPPSEMSLLIIRCSAVVSGGRRAGPPLALRSDRRLKNSSLRQTVDLFQHLREDAGLNRLNMVG